MKIYERFDGQWVFVRPEMVRLVPSDWRQIDHDPTVAHNIELDSCTAVITADSVMFDPPAPVLTLEEMQRVTRCMGMLKEAGNELQ